MTVLNTGRVPTMIRVMAQSPSVPRSTCLSIMRLSSRHCCHALITVAIAEMGSWARKPDRRPRLSTLGVTDEND
jgi:hypothetical protein